MKLSFKLNLRNIIMVIYMFGLIVLENGTPFMVAVKFLLILFTAVYVISKSKLRLDRYSRWILLYCGYCILSIFWAENKDWAFYIARTIILNTLCLLSFFQLCSYDKEWMRRLLVCLSLFPLLKFALLLIEHGSNILWAIRNYDVSVNTIGMFSGLAFTISLSCISDEKLVRYKWIWRISVFMNAFIAVISSSRKAIVFLVMPICVYYILSSSGFTKRVRNILLVLAGLLVGYYFMINTPLIYNIIGERFQNMLVSISGFIIDASTSGRVDRILYGFSWFLSRPLLGYGIGNYNFLLSMIFRNTEMLVADNNFIDLVVNGGIIGLLIYYALHYKLFRRIIAFFKAYNKTEKIFVSIFLVLFVCDIGISAYQSASSQFYLAVCWYIIHKPSGLDNVHVRTSGLRLYESTIVESGGGLS